MQNFNIVRKIQPSKSFRTDKIINMFDIDIASYTENFSGVFEMPQSWNIGVIVGMSGTGKTTIAKNLFKVWEEPKYSDKSIVDEIGVDKTFEEVIKVLSQVGFSSPPSWLKPFHVLSNGEKMRVNLANALLSNDETIVFDEFTSVVDRNVAKIVSIVVSKNIRKSNKKFIAVTCHNDIVEWLDPDWIFNTANMEFEVKKKDRQLKSLFENQKEMFGSILANIII